MNKTKSKLPFNSSCSSALVVFGEDVSRRTDWGGANMIDWLLLKKIECTLFPALSKYPHSVIF